MWRLHSDEAGAQAGLFVRVAAIHHYGADGRNMRDEYDFDNLNPRRNPYIDRLKKQVTISVDRTALDYFINEAEVVGIPYQMLISMYLTDCANNRRKLR